MTDHHGHTVSAPVSTPVRIPADVEREDKVLAGLTGRQLLILAATGLMLYALWNATRSLVPVWAFLSAGIPIGAGATVMVLGSRDGVSLDRLLLAALRQRLAPRRRVTAPGGVQAPPEWVTTRLDKAAPAAPTASELRLPAEAVTGSGTGGAAGVTGVVDLGDDGLAVVATCSTVNFALRTQGEQESLVACFGRYLHSLTAPIQVLIRTERLDLSAQISELQELAPGLPHPALEEAALEHAAFLTQLGEQADLLRRQILLVLREPAQPHAQPAAQRRPGRRDATLTGGTEAARRAAEARLARRLDEAGHLLGPAGITVSALDAGQATAVLAHACNPGSLVAPAAVLAGTDDIITTVPAYDTDDSGDPDDTENPGGYGDGGHARWPE